MLFVGLRTCCDRIRTFGGRSVRYLNLAVHVGLPFGRDLIVRGSWERLTPVLMAVLSAALALVPLLLGGGEPGREILHPVAVTIFGGLVSATLLDTVLTPVLFYLFGARPLAI